MLQLVSKKLFVKMLIVQKVLVVDDDIFLAQTIINLLKQQGIAADLAHSLNQAYQKLEQARYEIVILDRMLGKEDGIELISYLHDISYPTKILVISQLSQLEEKIIGLRLGADEYLPKPYSCDELLLRLKHLMIMEKRIRVKYLTASTLKLNPETGKLFIGENQVLLRRREADILMYLLKHKNTIVTRSQLIESIWGAAELPATATVDVYIRRLRLITKNPSLIKTIRGYGYMLSDKPGSKINFYNF